MGSRLAEARRCSVSFQYDTGHLIFVIARDAVEVAQFLASERSTVRKAGQVRLFISQDFAARDR